MKKFQFTLSRMLDYKDQLLEEAKNGLAFARRKKQEIDMHIAALEAHLDEISTQMKEAQVKGITAFQLVAYESQRTNIRRHIEQLRHDQSLAKLEVQKHMQAVILATQEVSKLDKLKESQLEDYKKMVSKVEELELEEFLSSKMALQTES